jgi:hypothetical protein
MFCFILITQGGSGDCWHLTVMYMKWNNIQLRRYSTATLKQLSLQINTATVPCYKVYSFLEKSNLTIFDQVYRW